ncbi:Lon protease [Planctomycetes bacterium MalM25]|nr:Lon protease [Planctomycetes bacterium MalM25]
MPSDPHGLGFDHLEFDPERFSGVARVFPLPAPSLFPRTLVPLHVFEERYLELMHDALDSDGLIAMAVLKPGWEIDYASRPPVEPIACLGKIVTHHRLENGRYNTLLAGVSRVRLLEEIEPPRAFRRARVDLLAEQEPEASEPGVAELQEQLIEAFREALPHGEPPEPLMRAFQGDLPLGLLADLAAQTLPMDGRVKVSLLADPSAIDRARKVLAALASGGEPGGRLDPPSPPPFSEN